MLPELHYELARFYRVVNASGEEELALAAAVSLLRESEPLTPARRGMLVDSLTRQGENLYTRGEYLEAQDALAEAIDHYEEGLRRRALSPKPRFGKAYAVLGDIYYYVGREYDQALRSYLAAEENGYHDSGLDYKEGYVLYGADQVDQALGEFRAAAEDPSAAGNALTYATANTYFRRENLYAAEAYYRDLVEKTERVRDSIRNLLVDEDPEHQSIVQYLIRGYNNLGVTLNLLSEQETDAEKYSEGLYYLTLSTELAENYSRERETLVRSDSVDLAYLNVREVLYPRPEYELQIYRAIPEDLHDLLF
jgi:hypothetical protein